MIWVAGWETKLNMIEILCSTICSGKSTWCRILAENGWIVINDDAIINAVHGGNYKLYKENLKPLYKSVEDHILHIAVAMGLDVVVDRGLNNTIRSRKRWVALARSLDVSIGARKFPIWSAEEHAIRRVKIDGRGHDYEFWLRVAKIHLESWQKPTIEEGFDYIEDYEWKTL